MVHNYSFMQTCLAHMVIKLTPKLPLARKKARNGSLKPTKFGPLWKKSTGRPEVRPVHTDQFGAKSVAVQRIFFGSTRAGLLFWVTLCIIFKELKQFAPLQDPRSEPRRLSKLFWFRCRVFSSSISNFVRLGHFSTLFKLGFWNSTSSGQVKLQLLSTVVRAVKQ